MIDSTDRAATPEAGLLLMNLGTPDAPTPGALRRFLREFLWDRRVVELPRARWWVILNLFVLTTRPRRSAELYREIWTEAGSPLLTISRRLTADLEAALRDRTGRPLPVALGMRYGSPSVADALQQLQRAGCARIVVLPLYPQYSATTTASSYDALFACLQSERVVPALHSIREYHDHPRYIDAVASSIRDLWQRDGEPDLLLMSFHGIPVRYAEAGDPYPDHCRRTAELLAKRLGIATDRYVLAYQSKFGREPWIEPATDASLAELARAGARHVDVVCPGFAVDCLETLEEIDRTNRQLFLDAGGQRFRYIPCLNDQTAHVELLATLVEKELAGWL